MSLRRLLPAAAHSDQLRLEDSGFASFAELQAQVYDYSGFSVIALPNGGRIWLIGVLRDDLSAGDVTLVSSGQDAGAKIEVPVSEVQDFILLSLLDGPVETETQTDLAPVQIDYINDAFGLSVATLDDADWFVG